MFSRFLVVWNSRFRDSLPAFLLGAAWISGLASGVLLFHGIRDSLEPVLWESLKVPVSAGTLCLRVLLPVFLCSAAVLLGQHWLVYGWAFGKALLLAFVSLYLLAVLGSGGWLLRFLLLFTDTVMCALWYGFWQDCLRQNAVCPEKALFLCAAGLFFAGLDLRVITPLLTRIITS